MAYLPPRQMAQISLATYITSTLVLAIALALLVWAFMQPELTEEQRVLANFFSALIAGSTGYLWGGVALTVSGAFTPHLSGRLKAFGGIAVFLITLWHPLFPPSTIGQHSKQLLITSPVAGGTVGPTAIVRGRTSYPRLNHYLIIEGGKGGAAIQDDPLSVSSTGELSGQGVFGSSAAGAGEDYRITLVATKQILQPGPYSPSGGEVYSNPVIVTRESSKETETRR